ncbi:peptidase M15-like protein [Algoriphagus aquaeductus]|jgi:zinc D-Ala-D-Ala carboxypeptidase|uniref:Peptidase M15-like protein n=1 Tax=Algoriphagus aquaeductus TaxID=475299 RepID=A0A326RQY7_9BACT|nr:MULTISPECIES: D-Ala-D-Ala carboxypeptidase family metallohydrolase [Algoriphagus]PZV83141.1 peptidase M15-like protein [Algoriphagus aquaeductus]
MQLSKNFPLRELLRSQTATRMGFEEQFTPSPVIIDHLRLLCQHVLQPLRDSLGRAVFVNSGYRCPRVNQAIGGSPNSQHLTGQAADIEVAHLSIEQLYQRIKNSALPYDQLIQEFDQWVHVSFNPAGGRRQCLRAVRQNGKVTYLVDTI